MSLWLATCVFLLSNSIVLMLFRRVVCSAVSQAFLRSIRTAPVNFPLSRFVWMFLTTDMRAVVVKRVIGWQLSHDEHDSFLKISPAWASLRFLEKIPVWRNS